MNEFFVRSVLYNGQCHNMIVGAIVAQLTAHQTK